MFLLTGEAAALLRLAASTLNKWRVAGGGPPHVRLGARVVYARSQVIAWALAQTRASTSEVA